MGMLFQGIPMADSMGGCCRAVAPEFTRYTGHFPSLATPVHEWLKTLSTHVQQYSAAVIHLELSQYFSFTGDSALYLKDIEEYVTLWQSPHPSQEKVWQGVDDNSYMLNREHLPWRERTVAQPEQNPEIQLAQSIPPTSGKRQPKWRQELYIWCLRFCPQPSFLPSMSIPPVLDWGARLPYSFYVYRFVEYDYRP
ncbi:hypothetical protein [Lysinibacillus sp. NPDC056232]|uniref:hypothetical protein n=1 Tax=Lysinibacillus sp. NPDC056232 TaxID=3345756 RepID=UPI0035DF9948